MSEAIEGLPVERLVGPDCNDLALLWAEIHRLRDAVAGPAGFATWKDAAVAERILRARAERTRDETSGRVVSLPVLAGCPWCGAPPRGIQNDGFFTYQCDGSRRDDGHLAVVHGETEQKAFDNWNRCVRPNYVLDDKTSPNQTNENHS